MLRQRRVVMQISDRLLPRPTLRMHSRINDQPGRPPDLIPQHPEPVVGGLIHAHLDPQPLAVQRPSFPKRGDIGVLPELRLVLVLHRDGHLETHAPAPTHAT